MSVGGYGWPGTVDELAQTDITRAYADHNILVERVMAVPEYAAAYRGHVNAMTERWFNPEKLSERREAVRPVLEAADRAMKNTGRIGNPTTQPALGVWHVAPELWPFVEKRSEWIRLQVNGRAVGFKPDFRNPRRTLAEWAPVTVAAVGIMDGVDADRDRRLNDGEVKEAVNKLFAAANLPAQSLMDAQLLTAAIDRAMSDEMKKRVPSKAWAD